MNFTRFIPKFLKTPQAKFIGGVLFISTLKTIRDINEMETLRKEADMKMEECKTENKDPGKKQKS